MFGRGGGGGGGGGAPAPGRDPGAIGGGVVVRRAGGSVRPSGARGAPTAGAACCGDMDGPVERPGAWEGWAEGGFTGGRMGGAGGAGRIAAGSGACSRGGAISGARCAGAGGAGGAGARRAAPGARAAPSWRAASREASGDGSRRRRDGRGGREFVVFGGEAGSLAGLARFACVARGLGAHDRTFDEQVVGAADHEQMLDVVAAHDDELAMTVEVVGVDDAEPWLAGASTAAQARAEHRLTRSTSTRTTTRTAARPRSQNRTRLSPVRLVRNCIFPSASAARSIARNR